MRQTVMIDPVTRIEGHAKITIGLDDTGAVESARLHVTEFRGFEAFCRGRPVWEMPSLTARTCGICPTSHLLASAKAGDAVMGVRIPQTAVALRRVANLGQIIQSHALSFFHLSSPDFLLGWESDPAQRNVFGLIAAEPELARRGIRTSQQLQKVFVTPLTPGSFGLPEEARRIVKAQLYYTDGASINLYARPIEGLQRNKSWVEKTWAFEDAVNVEVTQTGLAPATATPAKTSRTKWLPVTTTARHINTGSTTENTRTGRVTATRSTTRPTKTFQPACRLGTAASITVTMVLGRE